jgi:hypothetical protein
LLKQATEDGGELLYSAERERYKDDSGDWKTKRVITLYGNGVTASRRHEEEDGP